MARSKSGHDKGRVYVVIGEENDDFYLADGRKRGMMNPKRKRKKHVQPIKHFSGEVLREAKATAKWDDESVVRVISKYLEGINSVKDGCD